MRIRYQHHQDACLHLIDLFSKESKESGLDLIEELIKTKAKFRVIICGGDGTIPWVLSEIMKREIDLKEVVFGIIPIGTGNDFSRSLGWGSKTVKV